MHPKAHKVLNLLNLADTRHNSSNFEADSALDIAYTIIVSYKLCPTQFDQKISAKDFPYFEALNQILKLNKDRFCMSLFCFFASHGHFTKKQKMYIRSRMAVIQSQAAKSNNSKIWN